MSLPHKIEFLDIDYERIIEWQGKISLILGSYSRRSSLFKRLNIITEGSLGRVLKSVEFYNLKEGSDLMLTFPAGLKANSVQIIKDFSENNRLSARNVGSMLASFKGNSELLVLNNSTIELDQVAHGLTLKSYIFENYKTQRKSDLSVTVFMSKSSKKLSRKIIESAAICEGVYYARNLVNEPSNILGTEEFAASLFSLTDFGVEVEVLEEEQIKKLGMNCILAVGQGSPRPSKVVILKWNGGSSEQVPFVLLGKGVVFDSGGLSLKPSGGMEEMSMDMAGAASVAGCLRALALQRAKANVVGIVGLVENMPDGKSQRPGDIIKSMKGDTIEVVNTDAEGRLVLCDLLWFSQINYSKSPIINLATLTGAVIVALGYENAGVFSNDNIFCQKFINAAEAEAESCWQMPMNKSYRKLLKSRIADIANVGGRSASSITAAKFLENFVEKDTKWIHIDIAGVAFLNGSHKFGPRGATGWGVSSLVTMINNFTEFD